jgi:hypothetical protein
MEKEYFYKVSGSVNLTCEVLAGDPEEAEDVGKFLIKGEIEKSGFDLGEMNLTAEPMREATREELIDAHG